MTILICTFWIILFVANLKPNDFLYCFCIWEYCNFKFMYYCANNLMTLCYCRTEPRRDRRCHFQAGLFQFFMIDCYLFLMIAFLLVRWMVSLSRPIYGRKFLIVHCLVGRYGWKLKTWLAESVDSDLDQPSWISNADPILNV